jgi:hypothetical protein
MRQSPRAVSQSQCATQLQRARLVTTQQAVMLRLIFSQERRQKQNQRRLTPDDNPVRARVFPECGMRNIFSGYEAYPPEHKTSRLLRE